MQALPDDDALLDRLQRETFEYFLQEVNPLNGLITDKTRDGWPASIAATGLALASYPVGVERGLMTGYKGLCCNFLDMKTRRRAWGCEPSTVDTGFLLAGELVPGTS